MGQNVSLGRTERAEDGARGVTLGIGGGFAPGRVGRSARGDLGTTR